MTSQVIRYGGDYNPEQWPREVWDEDVTLMQRAGVTTATVGVFSWAKLEPSPGEYDFAWLDEVLDTLHTGGIEVILATATASPPPWLAHRHPESLPVTIDGVRLAVGSRQQYSPSSSAYREHALRLVRKMAERYARHPAVTLWHIGNEYGCHVPRSYDEESAAAFRVWLEKRYGTIDELNRAWGTAFWSQRYGSFEEVGVPSRMPTDGNATQAIDFDRFSSDALLELYRAEREVIRSVDPDAVATTNFMGLFRHADYWAWAREVDVISDDLYPDPADSRSHILAAATRDLMRSLGGGRPWLLMEQATSAVNWRPINVPKHRGQNRLHSLQCVARGADGILHFQWRQSVAGTEKFHSAMVPHAGPDSRIHREVRALGAELKDLGDLIGQPVPAVVAIVLDWDSWRAVEQPSTPRQLTYDQTIYAWYEGFLRRGVAVDFVAPGADTSGYRLVVAPLANVLNDAAVSRLGEVVTRGDVLVAGYQSGVLDEDLHARLGGYLGGAGSALQRALGVRVEEFAPLPDGVTTALTGDLAGQGTVWQEIVIPVGAQVVSAFSDGFTAGHPAVTRQDATGGGVGWYVATEPDTDTRDALVDRWLTDAGVEAAFASAEPGIETVVRGGRRFVGNHTPEHRVVTVAGTSVELEPYGALFLSAEGADR